MEINNEFLVKLLELQQDGKQAISAPSNWLHHAPLLEVESETDAIVESLSNSIIKGEDNEIANWHFFIGSPGNGKSAAIGKLVRILRDQKKCRITDESNSNIENLEPNEIPYVLRVFENSNPYPSALIIQDASVVRDPFLPKVDPAKELLLTLEAAWSKGVSLVVCTNRGVIEKAFRERHLDSMINGKPWFLVLKDLLEKSEPLIQIDLGEKSNFEAPKRVFQKPKISCSSLDNRSLLINSGIFRSLIEKATSEINWKICDGCSSKSICPFKANREWLADENGKENFLSVLRRAEAFSGQVIVLREALALISLMLSGCPKDYGSSTPCAWVKGKVASKEIFALASRRLFVLLYSGYSTFGLEYDTAQLNIQMEGIRYLKENSWIEDKTVNGYLEKVLSETPPSVDLGITRLVGQNGVLSEIDPLRECLPFEFLDKWDGELRILIDSPPLLFSDLDKECLRSWIAIEDSIEATPSFEAPKLHWMVRRWCSNYLLHLGGLLEGRTKWRYELDEYLTILEAVNRPKATRTDKEKKMLFDLDKNLKSLLAAGLDDQDAQGSIPLSENVSLSGEWIDKALRPTLDTKNKSANLSLCISFPQGESALISASAYIWLSRHLKNKLDLRCFPRDLLSGVLDARIRAAAKGKDSYAFHDQGVELKIKTTTGSQFTLSRFEGDVTIAYQ